MDDWRNRLRDDPLPWLLDEANPAARHLALRDLLGRAGDDADVRAARDAATRTDPIAAILAAQDPGGFWEKPGAGYATKYRGTVWSLIFLEQLAADDADRRVRAACGYVLAHAQTTSGGLGASGSFVERPPAPSAVIHCLNGNLLRALVGFGWLDDERVRRAIDWEARAITGDADVRYYASGTSGPGFACGANGKLPCGWGAVKALRGLAAIPPRRRTAPVRRALEEGATFLLSVDPATAGYPTSTNVNSSWFKLGFPSGYVTDVLQILEVLAELGHAEDPRLANVLDLVLRKQDAEGRWRNEYAYHGKTWGDIERQGAPSKWVTLRACRVLKAATR